MTETWEEILAGLKEAEERWIRLLKEGHKEEKPAILYRGPKPRRPKKKEEEARFPIFPLQNTNKARGGRINKLKIQLKVLTHQKTYEEGEQLIKIEEEIKEIKKKIKIVKKTRTAKKKIKI